MASKCQSLAATADFIIGRRPVLEPVLNLFGPLFEARDEAAAHLGPELEKAGIRLPQFKTGQAGEPLLTRMDAGDIVPFIRMSASFLLPRLLENDAIRLHSEKLESLFLENNEDKTTALEILAKAIFLNSSEDFDEVAKISGLPPQILDYASFFIFSTILRALLANTLAGSEEAPWDVEGVWQFGYCPVCGENPSLAWLDMRSFDEKNAFLSGGGGKKHLYCDQCGASWKFRRAVCPGCGKEGEGVMNILKESGSLGERVDWCARCKTYCPTVDLRELERIPNMDMMALGMIHLDMVAAKRKLQPLKASFWNMY